LKSCEKFISPESDYYIYSPSKSAQEMFFYPLQCGHFLYEAGYSLRRESYDSFLLMYIQKGHPTVEAEGRTILAQPNSFVLLDCYSFHAYSSEEDWECLWCHFDGAAARHWYSSIVSRLGNVFSIPDPHSALGRLNDIYNIFSSKAVVREPLMSKYLTDILTAFLLYTPLERCGRSHADIAEETVSYINEHFTEAVTVEELADRVSMSPFHFIRVFKKETGFTPHDYLINTRIANAKYLLKNSSLPIKDICYSTGFSCESVFCSAFKHRLSMTPAQYRLADNAYEQ